MEYSQKKIWGILTSLDLHNCDPELIKSADAIRNYVQKLCQLIGLKPFGECTIVHFGQREEIAGFSLTQLIETSLISGHFANKTNAAYIDVFSCGEYEPSIVANFTKNYFKATDIKITVLERN